MLASARRAVPKRTGLGGCMFNVSARERVCRDEREWSRLNGPDGQQHEWKAVRFTQTVDCLLFSRRVGLPVF